MQVFNTLEAAVELTEEERQLVDSVRALSRDQIAPRAADCDETSEFPWEQIEAINGLGLNQVFIPEEFGGAGLSFAAYIRCLQEIAKACASTGIIWATNFHVAKPLLLFGNPEQKGRLLPILAGGGLAALVITEASAGSDATAMRTRFTPDGDQIIVDGSKTFITSGDVADLLLVFGKWSEIDDNKDSISALILEKGTPGFEVLRTEKKLGHRASSTAAIAFNECRVPRANLVGEPGDGLRILHGSLNGSRPSVAAHALAIARAAFEDAVDYVNQREQSRRKIIDFQGIQFMLADMATELALAEAWLWYVVRLVDGGAEGLAVEASMLKMRASDVAMRITTDAIQLHGGYGYTKAYRVERLLRDAKITQIWEGTNQIHRQLIGRSLIER